MAHPIFHPDSAIARPLPSCWCILHGSETWRADADPHLHAHFGVLYRTHPGLARHVASLPRPMCVLLSKLLHRATPPPLHWWCMAQAAGAWTSANSRDSGAAAYSALGPIAHIEGWQKNDLFTRGGSKDADGGAASRWRRRHALRAVGCGLCGGFASLVLSRLGAGRVWHTSGAHDMGSLLARSSHTRLLNLPSSISSRFSLIAASPHRREAGSTRVVCSRPSCTRAGCPLCECPPTIFFTPCSAAAYPSSVFVAAHGLRRERPSLRAPTPRCHLPPGSS
jgi:hypothetical protein